ncbi:MAG TPA: lysophospholipid acyltransferase family protein [Longilinea sp.]|nr:lysophospholipid acyltransferase family protein [Longilinea sp.]
MLVDKGLYWTARTIISLYIQTMLKMNIENQTEIPDGPKIIAANHPSNTDAFYVAGMLPKRSYILITGKAFRIPVAGDCLRSLGHIPAQAGSGQEAVERSVELLRQGETVVIFPEGGKSPFKGFQKPKTGVARIALASGAPVIPMGIHIRTDPPLRYGIPRDCKEKHGGWYLRGPYNITIGKPLTFHGDPEDRTLVRNVANIVMHTIMELAYQSKQRMTPVSPAFFRTSTEF